MPLVPEFSRIMSSGPAELHREEGKERGGEKRGREKGGRFVIQFSKVAHCVPFPYVVGYIRSPIFPHLYQYCHYEFLASEYVA